MKKMIFLLLTFIGIGLLAACSTKREQERANALSSQDSLQLILDQKESELNDMVSTLNEIQNGFQQINQAQGRITVERQKGEKNQRAAIIEDMKVIQHNIKLNDELIAHLRQMVRESKSNSAKLKATMEETISSLTAQLEELNRQTEELRQQLAQKDITIAEQGEEITNLKTNVSELVVQNETKARAVASQDKELNTAFYVFGTKSELKEQNILKDGEVLRSGNFNKDYFTAIDIRVDKIIKLYSKSARIMTTHPSDSYQLDKDAKGQYTLRITDPVRFWSVSKYLVITVK